MKLLFCHVGEGLLLKEESIHGLEFFCDKVLLETYQVEIIHNTIVISSESILEKSDAMIKFANKDYCKVNLYSQTGLRTKPFLYL